MSLYPFIWKYFKFPIGHPVIHVGDACRDTQACLCMEGLIRCSIVPPDKLYHPVCLCRTCVHTPQVRNVRIPRMRTAPSRVPG
jgi:hypothetical protein